MESAIIDCGWETGKGGAGMKDLKDAPFTLDGLDGGSVEVPVRVRAEEHSVACLDGPRVDDTVDDGAHVRYGVHLGDGVL